MIAFVDTSVVPRFVLEDDITLHQPYAAAGPFPTVIGTPDALHLACARRAAGQYHGQTLLVFSHDRQMNLCARALGFATPLA